MVDVAADMLVPGDIIRFDYLIRATDEETVNGAVRSIKETISGDDRFDYQGSEHNYPVDLDTGEVSHMLSVYAQVRKYRRGKNPDTEPQEANIAGVAMVAAVALAALAVGSLGGAAIYKAYCVMRIATDASMSEETKQAALAALSGDTGIAGNLGLVGVGLLILAAFWLLGGRK